jgi:transcriptional regulator with XRE-family HTH domain
MTEPTGAERYLEARRGDPAYRDAHARARQQIDQIDRVIRALDERREALDLSKAELARRAGMPPEAVRRLFSTKRPNPTLQTLAAIADVLDLDLTPSERSPRRSTPTTRARSGASGTRRRTA